MKEDILMMHYTSFSSFIATFPQSFLYFSAIIDHYNNPLPEICYLMVVLSGVKSGNEDFAPTSAFCNYYLTLHCCFCFVVLLKMTGWCKITVCTFPQF